MKKFIFRICLIILIFGIAVITLLFVVPKDKNGYLCEYDHKSELMKSTPQPRVVIIGGSSVAFGTDSKMISDSLNMNVINDGLHAGIGIRLPIEEALNYIKQGDIVVLQIEYENFYNGGNGGPENLTALMLATDWKRTGALTLQQWISIIKGAPQAAFGNLLRVIKYPFTHRMDIPVNNPKFEYTKSGFNEYGDEVSHFNYPNKEVSVVSAEETRMMDKDFLSWLDYIIQEYENRGSIVVMLPPVYINSLFCTSYKPEISDFLKRINHPYIESPAVMSLDDSCTFNGGYHVNKEGVKQNSENIIKALKPIVKNLHNESTSYLK